MRSRRKQNPLPGAAAPLQDAADALRAALAVAGPKDAGPLALKLAAILEKLGAIQEECGEALSARDAARERRLFDAEMDRLIEERVAERLADRLRQARAETDGLDNC